MGINKIYRDRKGNKIGTQDNIMDLYQKVMDQISMGMSFFFSKQFVDIKNIKDKINTYLGIKYCYENDTSEIDNNLNDIMKQLPDFAKYIGYKPIKTRMGKEF